MQAPDGDAIRLDGNELTPSPVASPHFLPYAIAHAKTAIAAAEPNPVSGLIDEAHR